MKESSTILIIGPTPPPFHGVSAATRILLDSLASQRFSVIHLDTADRRGIAHVDQPDLWDVLLFLRQWVACLFMLVRNRPQICYLPLSQSRIGFIRDSFFMLPAFFVEASVVAHLHGGNFDQVYAQGGRVFQRYVDVVLRRVAKYVVLGNMLKPMFSPWATPECVAVVPNGVPDFFATERGEKETGNPAKFRVVFLSTLSRQKGLFVLIDAMALVAAESPEAELHIAGPWWGTGTEEMAHRQVLATRLTERVIFHGPLVGENKMRFLRLGDVFVFPGLQQEGQPLTVLEAMSAGLPVIATDRGCLRETVVENVTGFIVPPNSPIAIAERLLFFIRDRSAQEKFGRNARRRYEQEYTMSIFAARMGDVFSHVMRPDCQENQTEMKSTHGSTCL